MLLLDDVVHWVDNRMSPHERHGGLALGWLEELQGSQLDVVFPLRGIRLRGHLREPIRC